MPERHTIDGIHLNAAGYEVWDHSGRDRDGALQIYLNGHETTCHPA